MILTILLFIVLIALGIGIFSGALCAECENRAVCFRSWLAATAPVVALVIAGVIAWPQLQATKTSADVAEKTLKITQRADVLVFPSSVKGFGGNGEVQFDLLLRNNGPTPANDLVLTVKGLVDVYPPPKEKIVFLQTDSAMKIQQLKKGQDHTHTFDFTAFFSPQNVQQIESGALRFYLFGTISYKDIFKEAQSFQFLFSYNGEATRTLNPQLIPEFNFSSSSQ